MSNNNNEMYVCPDGHRCENGSLCMEKPDDEGGYYCDCDDNSDLNSAFAGLYCQHKATTFCTFNQEVSRISFCTNDGECKVDVSPSAAHLGCDCKDEYEGDHCQFVKGTMPDNWPFDATKNSAFGSSNGINSNSNSNNERHEGDKGLHGGVVAVIVLIVVAFVASVAFLVYRKKKAHAVPLSKDNHNTASSADLGLEADGGALKDSIRSMNNNNNSTTANAANDENGTTAEADDDINNAESMEDVQLSASGEGPSELLII